ncbi:MAG: hypothetical protein SWJ54_18515 [Cyanobacteriota bacterium]|nr:hypothetical protein [Cyanobacteriota bacterium]
MKLLKFPRFLVLAFTMILASVVAIAQTLFGVQQAPRLTAQLLPTPASTPTLNLNQMSTELAQTWMNSSASSNNPLVAQADSNHDQNAFSGCSCSLCQGVSV